VVEIEDPTHSAGFERLELSPKEHISSCKTVLHYFTRLVQVTSMSMSVAQLQLQFPDGAKMLAPRTVIEKSSLLRDHLRNSNTREHCLRVPARDEVEDWLEYHSLDDKTAATNADLAVYLKVETAPLRSRVLLLFQIGKTGAPTQRASLLWSLQAARAASLGLWLPCQRVFHYAPGSHTKSRVWYCSGQLVSLESHGRAGCAIVDTVTPWALHSTAARRCLLRARGRCLHALCRSVW
jgi:hypothetical protein